MELKLFAIKDKAQGFLAVFQEKNEMMALRNVDQVVNNTPGESMLKNHPQDFTLYCLGTFDTDTGTIESSVKFVKEIAEIKKD